MLSGCYVIPFSSDVPDQLESLRSQVKPGESTRREVHERFGPPFISSEHWRVEVFRVASGREGYMAFVLIAPWAVDTEEVIIYALVVYEENGVVEAINWDLYQHHDDQVYIEWRSARLQAGGFLFAARKEGPFEQRKEILLAPASETRSILHAPPPSNKCAVLLFFFEYGSKLRWEFSLNDDGFGGKPVLERTRKSLPRPRGEVFAKALVAEGKNELKMKRSHGFMPHAFRRKFFCDPGSVCYAYPKREIPDGKGRVEAEIAVTKQPVGTPEGARRLLFYNGKWLGDD